MPLRLGKLRFLHACRKQEEGWKKEGRYSCAALSVESCIDTFLFAFIVRSLVQCLEIVSQLAFMPIYQVGCFDLNTISPDLQLCFESRPWSFAFIFLMKSVYCLIKAGEASLLKTQGELFSCPCNAGQLYFPIIFD